MEEIAHDTPVASLSNPMEQDPAKLFIGGLHSLTDEESLQRYFEKYGEIKECIVMRDAVTKRSRGFGFVVFKDLQDVDKVLDKIPNEQQPYHVLDGKKIDPKRAIPKKGTQTHNQPFHKVFVGGLPPDITSQEIKEYFEAYGKVTEVLLMHDKNTKRLRGFSFVTFESETAGKTVCDAGFHKLKGKNVECKRAQPKEVMMLQGKMNLASFPFTRNYQNGLTSPVTYGIPDWSTSPQLYQQLVNWMSLGRGKAYTTGATGGHNYVTTAPQGFGNMPDHRRHTTTAQQYFTDYPNSIASSTAPSNDTQSPQTQEYNHHLNGAMTHASARQDMNNYITSRASFTADQQPGIYHGAQIATPQTASFGHSMPPITLRH